MASCIRKVLKTRLQDTYDENKVWFDTKLNQVNPGTIPFYASFDLRDADYKIAPVDANLFPAGFNNICSEDLDHSPPLTEHLFQRILKQKPESLLIIPEGHTRNLYYAENLYELRQLFRRAGIQTEIGWIEDSSTVESAIGPDGHVHLMTPQQQELIAYPVRRENNRLVTEKGTASVVLLNNDFSAGNPEILNGLEQPLFPNPRLGWHTRKKDTFFRYYNLAVRSFADRIGIDPWPLMVATQRVDQVDFNDGSGLDRIASTAHVMLEQLKKEYEARNISQKPFVFIKNNAGTYGIGVMKISDPQELFALNRRDKNKMAVGKGNRPITDVVVQEGIPTRFSIDGAFAEPVIYMLGSELLGGFLRKNPNRGNDDNLNSKGMVFQKLCISDLKRDADRDMELELVYGTIAQISALALTEELALLG